jgi:molybdopterin molybdotransferase
MPEFLHLLSPQEARKLLLTNLRIIRAETERIETAASLDRVAAEDLIAPHPLPEFARSTVDGYAVMAGDTYGATDSLPAYLRLIGEVQMGSAPPSAIAKGQCLLIHTGGMVPEGANAVVMLEHTQVTLGEHSPETSSATAARAGSVAPGAHSIEATEIEVLRPVAVGENVIQVGEDVATGQVVIPRGARMRPAEIGGLMALGLTAINVMPKPRVGLISSGDEVVPADERPGPGQVRDVNAHTLDAAISRWGGAPAFYGIVPDQPPLLERTAKRALAECDCVVITAGSSASARDQTADVINALGKPGVLVHGVNTRPGKPTILGVCDGKAVLGLPGNPVSALVNAYLFVLPLIDALLGLPGDRPQPVVIARLAWNLASEAGREDWWPVKLMRIAAAEAMAEPIKGNAGWLAEPIFGRSNLIFTLAAADGLLRIPADVTGLSAGEAAEVFLL